MILLLALVMSAFGYEPDPSLVQLDTELTTALAAEDADAAAAFERANTARYAEDLPAAAQAFEEVLAKVPGHVASQRRLCSVYAQQDRRAEGLALCRAALDAEPDWMNAQAMLGALAGPNFEDPTGPDAKEAKAAVGVLLADTRADAPALAVACQTTLMLEESDLFDRCVHRILVVAPDDPMALHFAALRSIFRGELDAATAFVDRGEQAGMAPEQVAWLRQVIRDEQPWTARALPTIGWALGGWAAAFLALLGAGAVLSSLALSYSERLPDVRSGEATGMAGGLRKAYRAVLWATCLFYYLSLPLVFLVVLGVGGGLVWAFFALGRFPIKLVLIIVLVVFATGGAMLKSLLVRARDEDPGDRLDLAANPRLRGALEEVAGRIGTRPVDTVYLTPGTDIAVFERGGLSRQLRGSTERCLLLGAGVLEGMEMGPFKSILAHEYGHFSNKDTAGGGFALAVRRSLYTMARSLAEGGAAAWYNTAWQFLRLFDQVFLRVSHGASRLQEVLADRWAAFAYGSAAFNRGLRHVIARSVAFDAHAGVSLNEVVQLKRPLANLYAYVPEVAPDADEIARSVAEAIDAPPSPYASHPRPADRMRWVEALAVGGDGGDDATPVWSLFSDPEAVQRQMTDQVRTSVQLNHGVRIRGEAPAP